MRWFFSLLFLGLLGVAQALSSTGNRLLVVVEELAEKAKYSKFLGDLEARGFDVSTESVKGNLALFELGERAYDHLLLLPTKMKGLGPNLTPVLLLQFVNTGGNILLGLSSSTPTPSGLVSLLLELDIHLPTDRTALVVDHFNYDILSAPDQHDVLVLERPKEIRDEVRNFFTGKAGDVIVFPHGVGQTLGNERPILAPVLRAPSTAYSYNPKEEVESAEDPFAVGGQLSLISTMQARNSARFTVIGAAEMLEDKWFDAEVKPSSSGKAVKTANQDFAKQISGWTFNEIGVLKVGNVEHYLNEGFISNNTNPKIYRIKNTVTYTIELSEWSWDKLIPFEPEEGDDVQLEFSMLSPFHRLPLEVIEETPIATVYGKTFMLPDQHGIFNFMVEYRRPFLSNIEEKTTVSVRHFAHNEYRRSYNISASWPWIAGIAVTVIGWISFVGVWLYSAPPIVVTDGKKVQ